MSSSSFLFWHAFPFPLVLWFTQWLHMAYEVADAQLSIIDSLSTTDDRI